MTFIRFILVLQLVFWILTPAGLLSQSTEKARSWELKGYLTDMQMWQFTDIREDWILDNQFQNRLDLSLSPGKIFRMGAGLRTRFFFGQTLSANPDYKGTMTQDPGLVNMTWQLASGNSFLLVTQFDRAWISLSGKHMDFTAGRQRINYGQAFIWNPNDIFNTYSYYDVDYPERPGSDALRLQVYPSTTSEVEAAAAWNREGKITVAGLGRFNAGQYDIQFLAGLVADQDVVFGAGWSGNLAAAGFRGEISYFQPKNSFLDTTGVLLATIGLDYTFANSLMLTFQAFYNQLPPDYEPENFLAIYQAPPSPKILSFAEWNLFLQGSYPVTPLWNVSMAVIYFPDRHGCYLGPSVRYSVGNNIDLDLFVQYFNGKFPDESSGKTQTIFFKSCLTALRLKWSF